MTEALSPLAADLRHHDRDRYQTALFAPADRQPALFALYAFNYEVARIREVVREPMLGQIRLQWWRDALDEIYAGEKPRHHDVVEPLAEAIRTHHLSHAHFDALLDARMQDIDAEPPATLDALETYAENSSARLVLLALEVLGIADADAQDAARGVGIAFALAGLLTAAPFHARARRLYLPRELTERNNVDLERSLFALKSSPALAASAQAIAERAVEHLTAARQKRGTIPRSALPALLPAILAARRLRALNARRYDLMAPPHEDHLQSLRLGWAVLRGRY
jgi:phytoene synthase